eukprot:TRINITY_DN19985_c0_g1_i1.p1 TRINITY_DN19985_c0_g1~~TRINITY_DN19985_c0_g1_i1.p1  ORF type:complete len:423 (+),score=65.97 TRINITY_DN19985_c0_g1_i1:54-1322(+)
MATTPEPEPDMESLALFMDAVPFQTLASIADGLENRLQTLSNAMFEPPEKEQPAPAGQSVRASPHLGPTPLSENFGALPTLDERSRRSTAFMTGVELEDQVPVPEPARVVVSSVQQVAVDYKALLSCPQPPPNCDPIQILQSVSDEIEFPKQWMRESWNQHFLSPLSTSIMQDLFWWFFNDEFALILHTLDNEDGLNLQPMEPTSLHLSAQQVMFNRISDCYTHMFWKVGLTMLTDDFFERYAEALADAVREAFDRGLEHSKHLFTDSSNDRDAKLRDLIVKWTTAITPRRSQPKANKSRRNIRCGRFDAVGHSPLMACYMKRHACVAPIGGSGVHGHNLHRLEVELRHDKVQWDTSHSSDMDPDDEYKNASIEAANPLGLGPAKQKSGINPIIGVKSLGGAAGMGTFSQKKADEVILGYLN